MRELSKTITISYYWQRSDGNDIIDQHVIDLMDEAEQTIEKGRKDGHSSGELDASLLDPFVNTWIEYEGHWKSHSQTGKLSELQEK